MLDVLVQMGALVAAGGLWRFLRPGGLDVDETRRAVTGLVYHLLLPALVLLVLWRAPLGASTLLIALVAAAGVLAGMGLSWLACRSCRLSGPVTGAAILAAGFPNVIYLGLPVLEATLGPATRSIAIQYDLFACTPLLFTAGVLVARHYGTRQHGDSGMAGLLRVTPLWAALAAVALNLLAVPFPALLGSVLQLMASAVSPLMLLAIGMSLRWSALWSANTRAVIPVLLIQLLIMPLLVLGLAYSGGLTGVTLTAVVLEAAMPSMVLGIVIADRYGLDTGLYAAAVTLSTLLSLVTLPLWFTWLQAQFLPGFTL